MEEYTLRFAAGDGGEQKTICFDASSTSHALELAKEQARGGWAELLRGERSLCRMRLTEETGVWRIEPTSEGGENRGNAN